MSQRQCLIVEIALATEMPNEAELARRNALIEELDKRQAGEFEGCGAGFNTMDFSYFVTDEPRFRAELQVLVPHFLPGYSYTVEPFDEGELADDEEGEPQWTPLGKVVLALLAIAVLAGGVWAIMKFVL